MFLYRATVTAGTELIPSARLTGPEGVDPPAPSALSPGESRTYTGLTEDEANIWRGLGEGLPGRAATLIERIPGEQWSRVALVFGLTDEDFQISGRQP